MRQTRFTLGRFDRNLAAAIGSAVRRHVLRCVKAAAVTAVRVRGARHDCARLSGVREGLPEIVDNLRRLTIAGQADAPVWLRLAKQGPGPATAGDFAAPPGLTFPDPDQPVATVEAGGALRLAVEVRSGVGRRPAPPGPGPTRGTATIALDATFSPVRRAWVELEGDEQAALSVGIETDGAAGPDRALAEAVAALLADLDEPFDCQQFAPTRGEFTSRWLPPGRAATLGNLLEAALLFGGDEAALEQLDVSFRIEPGGLDHPGQERLLLKVTTTGGEAPRHRARAALTQLRETIRAAGSAAAPAGPGRKPAFPPAGRPVQRRFQRVPAALAPDDPLAIPRDSFQRFLSPESAGWGLGWLLHEALRADAGDAGRLELVDWSVGEPRGDAAAARESLGTFARPVWATVRLTRPAKDTVEQRVHVADLPAMTARASFIVRGRERICISQLVPAPGVYFTYSQRWRSWRAKGVPHHGPAVRLERGPGGEVRLNGVVEADPPAAALATMPPGRLGWSLGEIGRRRLNARLGRAGGSERLDAGDVAAVLGELERLGGRPEEADDPDHMKNLIVRPVGEALFQQLQPAFVELQRALSGWLGGAAPGAAADPADLAGLIGGFVQRGVDEFFSRCPLLRDLDTTNALAMVSQARQVTRAGPGGLDRKRAGLLPRYVHPSHYGRFCVVDTPEGDNLGLLRGLSLYATLDEDGFVLAAYLKVRRGVVTDELFRLAPAEEDEHTLVGGDTPRDSDGRLVGETFPARHGYDYAEVPAEEVDFVGASPDEILGAPAHAIPLIEYDDPNRALMGANMSRQAVRLLKPELPIVATGYEAALVRQAADPDLDPSPSEALQASGASPTQAAAPGRNLLAAYLPWEGYNYEDGLVVSDRLIDDDAFTSMHLRRFTLDVRLAPQGAEQLTDAPPGRDPACCAGLDQRGVVRLGAEVRPGDVLAGKVRPDGSGGVEDASLAMPIGCEGKVVGAEVRSRRGGFDLPAGVEQRVRVAVAVRRRLKVGDKLANRHGAKGIVAVIVPAEDMPHLPDGTAVDIVCNPLGVPSRMNIGQLVEAHLSLAARKLGLQIVSPPLSGATPADVEALLAEAGLPADGRLQLHDGRTGRPFDQRSTVGFVYWRKLDHMVDDAFRARSTGAYDPASRQPVAGRRRAGGQKVGKMEIWALQSHGAAHNLREFLSIKADDAVGRRRIYDAIVRGRQEDAFGAPESANILLRELRAAALDLCYLASGTAVNPDEPYDVNRLDEVRIRLAPAEAVRGFSRGQVVSEASFDPISGEPAAGGLFCRRIFGPPDDEATGRERFERMGHIELAAPVVHPWLLSTEPNGLCAALGLDRAELEDLVYYRTGTDKAGAEAIAERLGRVDLAEAADRLRAAPAPETQAELAETLALLEAMKEAPGALDGAILEAIPVLPAGLRPAGRSAGRGGGINGLYEEVIRRNNRVAALRAGRATDDELRQACRQLQEAADALFGNGRGRAGASLSDRLKGVEGRFVQALAGKRADYSARTVVAPGPGLRIDQCGLGRELAMEVFRPFVVGELLRRRQASTRPQAEWMVDRQGPEARRALEAVVRDRVVLLVRAPALHRHSLLAFRCVLTDERVIRIHPNVTLGFNADFDGDEMTVHVPLSAGADAEAKRLLMAADNLFATASGAVMNRPSQDIVLGCYTMTADGDGPAGPGQAFATALAARNAWKAGRLDARAPVRVPVGGETIETTVGRVLFNELLGAELGFANAPLGRRELDEIISRCESLCGSARAAELTDAIKEFGFRHATRSGMSVWRCDPYGRRGDLLAEIDAKAADLRARQRAGEIDEQDRYLQTVDLWTDAQARMLEEVCEDLARAEGGALPVAAMLRSGARGSRQQMRMLFGMGGLLADAFGRVLDFPLRDRHMSGVGQMSYFLRSNGARAGLAMTFLRTASAGDLMRRIVEALEDVTIVAEDCGTAEGIEVDLAGAGGGGGLPLSERAAGRFAADDVTDAAGERLLAAGEIVSADKLAQLVGAGVERIRIRSPLTCRSAGGVCAKCYGQDVSRRRLVEVGSPVGISAALSLGEPLTQLSMRSFHLGHRYPFSKVARGKPEQDIKYSSGFPRLEEVFEMFEKRRAYGPALDGVDERPSAQSVLDGRGEAAARRYVLDELGRVYGEAGVRINSKHYEIAVRQMLSHVRVREAGETALLPGRCVHRDELAAANERARRLGRRPAAAVPLLLPISDVAARTGSFLASAASWQTVNVLVQAALRRDRDALEGMRANVILGRLIPVGAARAGNGG